jgi:hypothetical protein
MPYVHRDQQPFSPISGINKTLIGWYDNYNAIYNGPYVDTHSNRIYDKSGLLNPIDLDLSGSYVIIDPSIRKYTLGDGVVYTNLSQINARYGFNGISFFFVGAFGYTVTGTTFITLDNYRILSIDINNYINIGDTPTSSMIINGNNPTLISGSIDNTGLYTIYINGKYASVSTTTDTDNTTGSQLYIGDITNFFNNNTLSNINSNINIYLPDKGSNIYPRSLNTINEILVYNSVLNSNDIQIVNQYLLNKWNVIAPITYDIQNIPHLLSWYNIRDTNTFYFISIETKQVKIIRDISGLSNSIYAPTDVNSYVPTFSSNLINFSNLNTYYSTQLFTGTGDIYGLTISMVLSAAPYNGGNPYGTILSIPPSDIGDVSDIPTIINTLYGNIHGQYNNNLGDYILYDLNCTNIGVNNTNDIYVLTVQFQDYLSYQTSQIFINGLPMLQNNYTNNSWIYNSKNINYGGSIYNTLPYSCGISLGETLIYKKILNSDELNTVHTHLFSNYNIEKPSINNYLLWFNPNSNITNITNGFITNWGSFTNTIILSNTSTGYPFIRNYPQTFIDFDNGSSSYLEARNTGNTLRNISSNFAIYIVSSVNTGAINNKGSLLYMASSNGSYLNFELIYNNNNNSIFQITNFNNAVPPRCNVLSYTIINNILPTVFAIKINNTLTTNNISFYSIPNTSSNTQVINNQTASISFNNINTIRVGSNCRNSIGDIIIYNRPLVKNEEVSIVAYLQNKYAMTTKLNFPTDYDFWFDPKDAGVTWTDKTSNISLNYLGEDTDPVKEIIGCNTYYVANGTSIFYNNEQYIPSSTYNDTKSYTYFVVCGSNTAFNEANIFGIASGNSVIGYGLCTSLRNNSSATVRLYPTDYYTDIGNSPSGNNQIVQDTVSTTLDSEVNGPYIACVTYDNLGNIKINTKGSIYEYNTHSVTGQNFIENNNYIITVGGFYYYGPSEFEVYKNGDNFQGYIGDIIFYPRILTSLEILSVTQYLEAKYYSSNGAPMNIQITPVDPPIDPPIDPPEY